MYFRSVFVSLKSGTIQRTSDRYRLSRCHRNTKPMTTIETGSEKTQRRTTRVPSMDEKKKKEQINKHKLHNSMLLYCLFGYNREHVQCTEISVNIWLYCSLAYNGKHINIIICISPRREANTIP